MTNDGVVNTADGRVLPWKRMTVAQRAVLRCDALKVLDLLEQLARRTKR